jgi:serine/threonine-protein kinase
LPSDNQAETLPPEPSASGTEPVREVAGYEILSELGRGGMGVVYKARQKSLNRTVALKMILAGLDAGEQELERFRREAETLASLQHPNIVQIHEVGEHEGRPFFSLEYVDGGSLGDELTGTPLPARRAAQMIETLARAMHAAHAQNIVHRDLKPANVLLTVDGVLKITDFGLAKRLGQTARTRTGAIVGTPSYMAPEQADGKASAIGPAADIYALGALLYEMLTGRPPFKAETPLDTVLQLVSQEPVAPRQLQPKLPRDLETICLKCLHKQPERRYPSALDLANDLRRFLRGEPIKARPISRAQRASKWVKRRPALAALLTVSGLALLALLVVSLWYNARLQAALTDARDKEAEAVKQQKRARDTLRRALEGVDRLTRVNPERMAILSKHLDDERRQQLTDALELCRGFVLDEGEAPSDRHETGRAYLRMSILHWLLGQNQDSETAVRKALTLLEKLVNEFPGEPEYCQDLARSHKQLGHLHLAAGRFGQAQGSYETALTIAEPLTRAHPPRASCQQLLAETHINLGILHVIHKRHDEALKAFQKQLAIYEELARQSPEEDDYQCMRVAGYLNVGRQYLVKDDLKPAEEMLTKVGPLLDRLLAKGSPTLREYPYLRGVTQLHLGMLYYKTRQLAKAEINLRQGFTACEQLAREYPRVVDYPIFMKECVPALADLLYDNPEALLDLCSRLVAVMDNWVRHDNSLFPRLNLCIALGVRADEALTRLGRHAEALKDWDRALALDGGRLREILQLGRACTLARQGDYQAALKVVSAVKEKSASGDVLFYAARGYALICGAVSKNEKLALAERGKLAEQYATRSVELLRQAHPKGLSMFTREAQPERLRKDPDFVPMGTRPDFQKLLGELEKQSKKPAGG